MKKTIIAITGRTAAGKSVVAKKMAERLGLKVLQSYTTRQPRPDELADMEHSDHIFISNEEYNKLQDIAAETEINGCRYCTTVEVLNQCDFYVIDPDGIDYLKKEHGKEFHIVQFYIYANDEIRKERFLQRGNTESDFESRNADESNFWSCMSSGTTTTRMSSISSFVLMQCIIFHCRTQQFRQ
ncbi:MAG: AAA family ATPase [Lachnospiraceae bacterium]